MLWNLCCGIYEIIQNVHGYGILDFRTFNHGILNVFCLLIHFYIYTLTFSS